MKRDLKDITLTYIKIEALVALIYLMIFLVYFVFKINTIILIFSSFVVTIILILVTFCHGIVLIKKRRGYLPSGYIARRPVFVEGRGAFLHGALLTGMAYMLTVAVIGILAFPGFWKWFLAKY